MLLSCHSPETNFSQVAAFVTQEVKIPFPQNSGLIDEESLGADFQYLKVSFEFFIPRRTLLDFVTLWDERSTPFPCSFPCASVCVYAASSTSDCRDSLVQTSSRKGKQRVEGQSLQGSAGEGNRPVHYQEKPGQSPPPEEEWLLQKLGGHPRPADIRWDQQRGREEQ